MNAGNFYASISDSLWRLTEMIRVDTQRAVPIKHCHLNCEMAPLCCAALVLPDGFFGNVDKSVHFLKTSVSWCSFNRKPHSVRPPGIELTLKAARESDNFIWGSMCWDQAPVRILSPKGRAKSAHQKMSQVTRSAPLWTGRRGAGGHPRCVYRRLQAKHWGQAGSGHPSGPAQHPGVCGDDN